mmetsp:Transcript_20696/g.65896  ORF Transcript_20696/g.65896 Transcript_20696/m.65896 type:complete len:86 (+) Transcript_20696:198-455(+)
MEVEEAVHGWMEVEPAIRGWGPWMEVEDGRLESLLTESSTPRSAVIDTRRPPLLGRECASSTNGSHRQEPKHDTAARPCLSYEVR